jgi:ATP-binding cassette, subfamily B, bacterial
VRSVTTPTRVAWRASRLLTCATVTLVLLGALAPLAYTITLGLVIDSSHTAIAAGRGSENARYLLSLLALLAVLYAIQAIVVHTTAAVTGSLTDRFALDLRRACQEAALSPPGIAHLETASTRDELEVVGSDEQLWYGENVATFGVAVLRGKLAGIGGAVLLASMVWWAPAPVFVAIALGYRWLNREMATINATRVSMTPGLRRAAYLRELAVDPAAAKEIRVFGLGSWLTGNFASRWIDAMRPIWKERRLHATPMMIWVAAELASAGIVLGWITREVFGGALTIGALAVAVGALREMENLGPQGVAERNAKRGLEVVQRLENLPERLAELIPPGAIRHKEPTGAPDETGIIRLEHVDFTYPGASRPVLRGLSLDIRPGESLALVGPNGAGKTTILKLLMQLYVPDAGHITVNGIPLTEIEPQAWRRHLAVVFQDFVRYELSMRENIGFGAVEHMENDDALSRAAHIAGATTILDDLPRGWNTILSRGYEHGVELSGGQWQRIALARALFALGAGARVLILDEPTSNLDPRAEAELFERTLAAASATTTILVSHRFSTVRYADRIVVIAEGQTVEQGAHDELMVEAGYYARMFRLQAKRFQR